MKIFHFFDSWEIIIYPPKIDISCFFYGIRIFGGTFDNSSFFNPNLFYYNILFVFFYFINEKKLLIKYFFIINVPINYPPLSKKSLNLSKSCPISPKKIRKIPKNPEKSRFFHFFSYGLDSFFMKSRCTIYRIRS